MTPYFQELARRVEALGGYHNAHLHLDRAGTYSETVRLLSEEGVRDGSSLSLAQKHAVIPLVHASSCYDPEALGSRVSTYIERMISTGTRRADTLVDVTTDRVKLSAMEALLEIKARVVNEIEFRIGAYSPFGYRDDEFERWDLVTAASERADFIGLLPERDDRARYPEHIGFEESCLRGVSLAMQLRKPLHIHVDQTNREDEDGTERLVKVLRELGYRPDPRSEPLVWLIHFISPSTYPEPRFERLLNDLVDLNLGVICCPSAAISMRQYRPIQSPTHNSIARVLELLAAGVPILLGSDNICDVTSPMGTPDLMSELFVLANSLRFCQIEILAKLAAGIPLDEADREIIQAHLVEDQKYLSGTVPSL